MKAAAGELEFEEAARLRDEIRRLNEMDLGLKGARGSGAAPAGGYGRSSKGAAGTQPRSRGKKKSARRRSAFG